MAAEQTELVLGVQGANGVTGGGGGVAGRLQLPIVSVQSQDL